MSLIIICNSTFQGIPWHIIGYKHLIISETGELQVVNTFHVFVMLKKENKEAAINVALMSRSLEIFSISNPQIVSVSITSDNAGYVIFLDQDLITKVRSF